MSVKSNFKNKFETYDYIKNKLQNNNIVVNEYKEINYGLQFNILISGNKEVIRVYESKKKGVSIDFSQVKSKENLNMVLELLEENSKTSSTSQSMNKDSDDIKNKILENSDEVKPLIGTDESGKGDFFGPLVVAAVYADASTQKILRELGVDDSKKLTDKKINIIAEDIKKLCKYSVLTIGNEKYNQLYGRIANLNKLLAWGHARVIENLLEEVECQNVLSDQFGSPDLIENALMDRGKKVKLDQRPRAEENVVVAAASILARDEFVKQMEYMSEKYGLEFVKGASSRTIIIGKSFAEKYGKGRLNEVAKLHFKTLDKI